jgi:endo-1,4-beta-xylanase
MMRIFNLGLAFLAAMATQPAWADDAVQPYVSALSELRGKLPADAKLINQPGVANWNINGSAQTTTVPAKTISGGKALSVEIKAPQPNAWDVSVSSPITESIASGDTLFLAVQVRASSADNEAQSGVISASKIEESGGAFAVIADTAAQVSGEWITLYSTGVASRNYAAGDTHITIHMAAARQTIEIGNAYAFNLGPNADLTALPKLKITYPGREPAAAWRGPAKARIDAIRKGDIALKIIDAAGAAVSSANVRVAMTRHAFHFGSFVGHDVSKTNPDAQKLRETFPLLFNAATSPIYWSDWGWETPSSRASYLASMKYLSDNDIPWRAHTVIWAGENWVPTRLKALAGDPEAYKKAVLGHVANVSAIAARYKPFTFDVINEPRDDDYTINRIGIDGVADAFRIVQAAAPGAHLFVNDYGIISGGGTNMRNLAFYHEYLDRLAKAGAPVSGIGMQGHFGALLTDPARVLAIFDDFARHNMPIQITEFDIDTTDEEAQADYTRDILTAAFSHPSVEAFMVWGWWEGDHWRPKGAMMRRDWSAKPNYHAWRKLVFSDWWTDETQMSDGQGTVKLRGFLGNYRATVKIGNSEKAVEFTLPKEGTTIEIRM